MTLKEAGEAQDLDLAPDWYRHLNDSRLVAYIRYQYIWRHNHVGDWDSPAHTRRIRAWDGGEDRFGVKHSCVWNRTLAACRAANADPGLWVAAHFSDIGRNQLAVHTLPEVRPSFLHSSTSFALYQKYCATAPKILQQAFEVAGRTIADRMRGTMALKLSTADQVFYVLCDETYVSATPFFRAVFAEQLNCSRSLEKYLWAAGLEYDAQQRMYNTALDPAFITPAFYGVLKEVRDHWRAYT
jgi:hypothetical protein